MITITNNLESLPTKEYVLERLEISPGNLILLCGTGSSGKSMVAQYIACCVSSGHSFFDKHAVKQGAVVHLDAEQSENQTLRRYMRIANGMGITSLNIARTTLTGGRLDDQPDLTAVKQELIEVCSDKTLCLIDSLKACSSVDENSAEIQKLLDVLKKVGEVTKCAILLIHHKGKGKDAKQSGRGHSSIYDSVDVQIDLDVLNEIYEAGCAKNRDGKYFAGFKYHLLDTGDYVEAQHCSRELKFNLLQDDIKSTKQSQREKILSYLSDTDQIKYNDLFDLVGGDRAKFREVLDAMMDADEVVETAGPRNSKLYSLTQEYKNAQLWVKQ